MSFKSRRFERDILRWLIVNLGEEVPKELQEKETIFQRVEKFLTNDISSTLVILGLIVVNIAVHAIKFILSFYH